MTSLPNNNNNNNNNNKPRRLWAPIQDFFTARSATTVTTNFKEEEAKNNNSSDKKAKPQTKETFSEWLRSISAASKGSSTSTKVNAPKNTGSWNRRRNDVSPLEVLSSTEEEDDDDDDKEEPLEDEHGQVEKERAKDTSQDEQSLEEEEETTENKKNKKQPISLNNATETVISPQKESAEISRTTTTVTKSTKTPVHQQQKEQPLTQQQDNDSCISISSSSDTITSTAANETDNDKQQVSNSPSNTNSLKEMGTTATMEPNATARHGVGHDDNKIPVLITGIRQAEEEEQGEDVGDEGDLKAQKRPLPPCTTTENPHKKIRLVTQDQEIRERSLSPPSDENKNSNHLGANHDDTDEIEDSSMNQQIAVTEAVALEQKDVPTTEATKPRSISMSPTSLAKYIFGESASILEQNQVNDDYDNDDDNDDDVMDAEMLEVCHASTVALSPTGVWDRYDSLSSSSSSQKDAGDDTLKMDPFVHLDEIEFSLLSAPQQDYPRFVAMLDNNDTNDVPQDSQTEAQSSTRENEKVASCCCGNNKTKVDITSKEYFMNEWKSFCSHRLARWQRLKTFMDVAWEVFLQDCSYDDDNKRIFETRQRGKIKSKDSPMQALKRKKSRWSSFVEHRRRRWNAFCSEEKVFLKQWQFSIQWELDIACKCIKLKQQRHNDERRATFERQTKDLTKCIGLLKNKGDQHFGSSQLDQTLQFKTWLLDLEYLFEGDGGLW